MPIELVAAIVHLIVDVATIALILIKQGLVHWPIFITTVFIPAARVAFIILQRLVRGKGPWAFRRQ